MGILNTLQNLHSASIRDRFSIEYHHVFISLNSLESEEKELNKIEKTSVELIMYFALKEEEGNG